MWMSGCQGLGSGNEWEGVDGHQGSLRGDEGNLERQKAQLGTMNIPNATD